MPMLIIRKGSHTIFCSDISIHSSTPAQFLPALRVANVLTKSTIRYNPFVKQNNNRAEEDPIPMTSASALLSSRFPSFSQSCHRLNPTLPSSCRQVCCWVCAQCVGGLTTHKPHSVSSPLCQLSPVLSYPYSALRIVPIVLGMLIVVCAIEGELRAKGAVFPP